MSNNKQTMFFKINDMGKLFSNRWGYDVEIEDTGSNQEIIESAMINFDKDYTELEKQNCLLAAVVQELVKANGHLQFIERELSMKDAMKSWLMRREIKHGDAPKSVLLWANRYFNGYTKYQETPAKNHPCRKDYDRWMRKTIAKAKGKK